MNQNIATERKTFTITFWHEDLSRKPKWNYCKPQDFKGIARYAASIIRNEKEDDGKWRETERFTVWDGSVAVIDRVVGGKIQTYEGMIDPQIRYIVAAMQNEDKEHQQPSLVKYLADNRE